MRRFTGKAKKKGKKKGIDIVGMGEEKIDG